MLVGPFRDQVALARLGSLIAVERLICAGVLDRHPGVRIVLVHGCSRSCRPDSSSAASPRTVAITDDAPAARTSPSEGSPLQIATSNSPKAITALVAAANPSPVGPLSAARSPARPATARMPNAAAEQMTRAAVSSNVPVRTRAAASAAARHSVATAVLASVVRRARIGWF